MKANEYTYKERERKKNSNATAAKKPAARQIEVGYENKKRGPLLEVRVFSLNYEHKKQK